MEAENDRVLPAGALRRLTTLTAVFIVVLELLDVTIVNVALPDIQGSLGAKVSTIAWVITAYILASTLMTPLTGFLSKQLGRRTLLLLDIPLFILFSFFCGTSTTIYELIVFRALQGVAAGTMVPLAQAVLVDIYPKTEYTKAMALFGLGVMLGPILGPCVGGIVDQHMNWHWIFFINIPIGIVGFLLAITFVKETPKEKSSCDFLGLTLMAITIVCLQLFLSQGNSYSWFQSHIILFLFAATISAGMLFISTSFWVRNPIVNLRLFFNRNFAGSCLFIFCYGTPLLGSMVLIPLFLGDSMNYPPMLIGNLLLIRGLGALLAVPIVANILMRFFNIRVVLIIGTLCAGVGNWMLSNLNADIAPTQLYFPLILQGISTACIMPPLLSISFSTLSSQFIDDATGLFNFCRSLGSSIGIALTILILDVTKQYAWSSVGEHINKFNSYLSPWLAKQSLTLSSPTAGETLGNLLTAQSSLLAYLDTFRFIAILSCCLALLSFLIKAPHKITKAP